MRKKKKEESKKEKTNSRKLRSNALNVDVQINVAGAISSGSDIQRSIQCQADFSWYLLITNTKC